MINPVYQEHYQALPGPDNIFREELSNGITVLTRSNFNSPTLSIKGYLNSGSLLDPVEKLGLSYLTAYGLMNGTANYNFQSLYNEVESVGARLSFSAGTLTTAFSAHCLSEDLSLILGLISECLLTPTFPQKEFNRQKTQMLTALEIRSQNTAAMAALLFDRIIYADHPYEHPEEGHLETILAVNRQDIANFYERTFGPRDMVVVIVGAVEGETAIEGVKNTLGEWQNQAQDSLPEIPAQSAIEETTQKIHTISGKIQTDLVMGSLAPERCSPDYFSLLIGNNILGEFGMMGRLGQSVREQAGLAYYAYSSLSISKGPGAWEMIAGVNPANVNQTILLITDQIKKFVTEPVSIEELNDSKSYYLGRMPLMLESNSGVAISLLNMEFYQLGMNYFLDYPKNIQAITAEEILKSSKKYLDPDRLAIAYAGP